MPLSSYALNCTKPLNFRNLTDFMCENDKLWGETLKLIWKVHTKYSGRGTISYEFVNKF